MKKKASKKKKVNSKKKSSGNIFTSLIIIVFIIVFVGFFVIKYIPNNKNKDNVKIDTQLVNSDINGNQTANQDTLTVERKVETTTVAKSIEGCWMSTTGGAVLTMKNFEYRIDFMGVDIGKPIIGTYTVDGNIVTFTNKQDPCKETNGAYEVDFDKKEISFQCKNDDCTKRKSALVTDWEWLEE